MSQGPAPRFARAALFAVAGLAVAAAIAAGPSKPVVRTPFPFEHDEHAKVFAREGVMCTDCHLVGIEVEAGQPPATLVPSHETCHGCHLGQLEGAPRKAPSECSTCHEGRGGLLPPTHAGDWMHAHGDLARSSPDSAASTWAGKCSDCHDTSFCIDCHDTRGAGAREPHPPGFRATHGVEARLDPRSCAQCHTASSCTTCHLEGSLPW